MKYTSKSKGIWIMKDNQIELENKVREEESELNNPDNILFFSEPMFLINKAPKGNDLSYALERDVPVVVILTIEMFPTIQERIVWEKMNIPELNFVCIDWAGDSSNIPFIKNKWRQAVRERHTIKQKEMKRNFETKGSKKNVQNDLPPILKDIFDRFKDAGDHGGFAFSIDIPPTE